MKNSENAVMSAGRWYQLQMPAGQFRLLLSGLVVVFHTTGVPYGAVAVHLFFVLSGYWISRMWCRQYSGYASPYRTFVISRAWRILPLYWICYAVVMVVSWRSGRFDAATWSAVGSLEWWLRTVPLIGAASLHELMLLRPAWSLDFEAQFYLVAPLIVSMASDRRRRTLLWMAAVLIGAAFAAGYAVLPGTVLQFGGFFLAGVLCERGGWVPGERLLGFSQPVFAGALLWLAVATVMKQGGVAVEVFPAGTQHWCEMLIVIAGMPTAIGSCRMASDATDRHLGNLAFPLYLVHDAVDVVFEKLAMSHGLGWKLATLPLQWLLMASSAVVLYFWVDRPIDRLRQRWTSLRPRKKAGE